MRRVIRRGAWKAKAKDSAVYLLTAVATGGSTTQVSFSFPPLSFSSFSADVRWFLIACGDEYACARRCCQVLGPCLRRPIGRGGQRSPNPTNQHPIPLCFQKSGAHVSMSNLRYPSV